MGSSSSTGTRSMGAEAFLDTNILLYALVPDRTLPHDPRAEIAEELLARGGVVSVQVLSEFCDVASRKLGKSWSDLSRLSRASRLFAAGRSRSPLNCIMLPSLSLPEIGSESMIRRSLPLLSRQNALSCTPRTCSTDRLSGACESRIHSSDRQCPDSGGNRSS